MTACDGDKGDVGPAGPAGQPGAPGSPGAPAIDVGSIEGTLKTSTGAAVPGATVTVDPAGVTATSDASGKFTVSGLKPGVYSVVVTGPNATRVQKDGVIVVAGGVYPCDMVVAYTPLKLTVTATPQRAAGFGTLVDLKVAVTGATGPLTYKWEPYYLTTLPQAYQQPLATLTGATTANASFTTGVFEDMLGKAQFFDRPDRPGVLAVTPQQSTKNFNYNFRITVSDGTYSQTATVAVYPVVTTQGLTARSATATTARVNAPKGLMLVLNDDADLAAYSWSITAKPAGSAAALKSETTRNPWFTPDMTGQYVVANQGGATITVDAAEYVGLGANDPQEVGCLDCHSGGLPGGQLAAWWDSAHAEGGHGEGMRLVELNLRGLGEDPAHYGENCLACHAIGFDKQAGGANASNNGFDDRYGSWKFPVNGPNIDNWTPMPAALKNRSGMQCEACHGPASGHLGAFMDDDYKPAAFFSPQPCASCHDSVGHHDRYQLWSQSRHSNRATAISANRSHCTRCHNAETFVQYVNAGGFDAPDVPQPAALANEAIEPITCQACHDPHTTALRIDGSKPTVLPAGFTVAGGGFGQLCMACHNTRNGAKGDAVSGNAGAPHHSAQADVLYGKNVYFMTGQPSKHVYVAETCVGCHLEVEAADPALILPPATTNHAFRAKGEELCAECHGPGVTPEGVALAFEAELHDLAATFESKFIAAVTGKTWQATDILTGDTVVTKTAAPVEVVVESGHGQAVLFLTFADDSQIETRITNVKIDSAGSGTFVALKGDGKFAKAAWNYLLLEFDGSKGVHNPQFARDVIAATKANVVVE